MTSRGSVNPTTTPPTPVLPHPSKDGDGVWAERPRRGRRAQGDKPSLEAPGWRIKKQRKRPVPLSPSTVYNPALLRREGKLDLPLPPSFVCFIFRFQPRRFFPMQHGPCVLRLFIYFAAGGRGLSPELLRRFCRYLALHRGRSAERRSGASPKYFRTVVVVVVVVIITVMIIILRCTLMDSPPPRRTITARGPCTLSYPVCVFFAPAARAKARGCTYVPVSRVHRYRGH